MGYTFRQCPAKSECTLKIYYGGEWKTDIYTDGRVIWVDIDSKTASLTELKDIASKLGYQDTQLNFSYKLPTTRDRINVITNKDVAEMIKKMPYSRDLELYIDGVRKNEKPDELPTILFWNCRGLGKSATDLLNVLIAIYDPSIIFLIETRLSHKVIEGVSSTLGFNVWDFPTSKGGAGIPNCVGLAMLMKTTINVDCLDKTSNYLDFVITMNSTSKKWRLTGFYGHPKVKDRSWKWLRKLKRDNNLPWIIFGDFNEILDVDEKIGGQRKDPNKIYKFNKVVEECGLLSLSFEGSRFTWKRNNTKQRLDRVFVTKEWKNLFQNPRVLHLASGDISDHIPIVIQTDGQKYKVENSEPPTESLVEVLSFAKEFEDEYNEMISCKRLTTISNIAKMMKQKRPNFNFEVAKAIAPEVIHAVHTVVHDKIAGTVKYDRQVRLKSSCDLSYILWNCIVLAKTSPDDDLQVAPDFPSDCCTQIITNEVNLSEYLAQAWELLLLIPPDRKSTPQHIIDQVHQKIDDQVEDLVKWLTNLFAQVGDEHYVTVIGKKEHKDMGAKLKLRAEFASRAVILYKIIISLIRERKMAFKGRIEDIMGGGAVRAKYYVPDGDDAQFRKLLSQFVDEPLKDLLETFKWRVDDTKYEIDIAEDQKHLDTLEARRFDAEKTWMMWENLSTPLMKKIDESGSIDIQNLGDVVRDSFMAAKLTVQDQIDLLTSMEVLFLDDKNGKLHLVDAKRSPQLIVARLKQAAATALKTLEKSTSNKPIKYGTYIKRITSAYNKLNKRRS